jgi:hypothetical protein
MMRRAEADIVVVRRNIYNFRRKETKRAGK